MGFFSRLFDAIKSLFGGRKETPSIPHPHYYNEFMGYWASNAVTLRAGGPGLDVALSRVAAELNRGAKAANLPYTFSITTQPGETILVLWDTNGKVPRGVDAHTPPQETVGVRPDIPQAVAHSIIYVRSGKSGDYLYRLILHETFAHSRSAMGDDAHSGDERDVGHPSAKASSLSAADIATWKLAFERRRRDGLEG